ncbi:MULTISPECIES: efflux RND transporter periplasmic adaptor subunit [unclassified Variovorax]|uniref:efflux RND transporter periplasmic adaptor subunit n=1 Tax=unclassified Variovorax TaxID=663243 RepID=UPI000F7DA634|nr:MULTISPECIES: efflux RND transporter periplasmic adaptor subunit [unclassified Variovorax]RSZ29539.1 efflux RND transporter periplasmic adaptor subunit [Variovorax sp. 553]RSZ30134.1 efflux RND transporter periplasmic adaptor subunit [Variovorax sp. 679]
MKLKSLVLGLMAAGVLAGSGYGLYALGKRHGGDGSVAPMAAASNVAGDKVDPATGRKVLYWHDPMVPGQKFDKPGKSPFMDMQLVPVYAGESGDEGTVAVSPRVQQNLGIRTAEVARGEMTPRVEAAGSIAFNERDQAFVQARSTGYVEKLFVRATLDPVSKGQPLAELYVPDWVAAQEEFLSVRRMQGTDLAVLVDGARQRMRQVGMTDEQIRLVEHAGRVQPRITLVAPTSGVIVELTAREGMTVMPGATLFRINGLSTVWANADVPESQSALLRPGAVVEARSPALPGKVFKGKVQAILPEVNQGTRTIKARVELANPQGQLAPGMFVSVALNAEVEQGLMVPTEAIIQTGRRMVVMVAEGDGKFRPVDVEIGSESNGQTEVKRGLQAGQKVVTSGQFLIDSEASLRGTATRMEDAGQAAGGAASGGAATAAVEHTGKAKVEAVGKDTVSLSHEPIPSMQWGAMTMDFGKPAGGVAPGLKPGQTVNFAFQMSKEGLPVLTRIEPAGPGATPMPIPAPAAKDTMPMGSMEKKQ